MSMLDQSLATVSMGLRNLPSRAAPAIVAAVGIAGVVAVIVGVLSMREGFRSALQYSGRDDYAVVLRSGSGAELASTLSLEQTRVIEDSPGIARDARGPIAAAELYVIVDVPMISTGTASNVPLRGVTGRSAAMRKDFAIVAGRPFTPGTYEIIVGQSASEQFGGLELGGTAKWGSTEWRVVGVFADNGSVAQGEVWADSAVLQAAYNRGSTYQVVRARLDDAAALTTLTRALADDPRLKVKIYSEREYYAEQSRLLTLLVTYLGYSLGILMGLGAVFAALNTMYSAVAARTREIATLRALGFGAAPIVVSVLVEALAVGLAGALLGALAAYLGFNGIQASTLNFNSFSQLTFSFNVTVELLLSGIAYAMLLAFIGGLLPAVRAARLPVVEGLRSL